MWALATLYRQASYLLSDNESYSQCNQGRFPLLTESAFTQLSDHKLCTGFFLCLLLSFCSVQCGSLLERGNYGHDHQCAGHTNLLFHLLELPEIVVLWYVFFCALTGGTVTIYGLTVWFTRQKMVLLTQQGISYFTVQINVYRHTFVYDHKKSLFKSAKPDIFFMTRDSLNCANPLKAHFW